MTDPNWHPHAWPGPPPGYPPQGGQQPQSYGPPGYGPQGWPPGPQGWPAGAPPPRGRSGKSLLAFLLAAVAVLAVIGIVVTLAVTRGHSKGGSAGDAAKTYLQALADGDADTALSLGSAEPASKKFLTAEVLKKQIEKWPITNINVTDDPSKSAGGFAIVEASADIGGKPSKTQLSLKKRDGKWKLDSAAVNIKTMTALTPKGPGSTLELFGEPVGGDSNLYVFPGYLGFGSTIPYFDVSAPPLLLDGMAGGDIAFMLDIKFALNDAGRTAVNKAVETWLAGCLVAPEQNYNCANINADTPMDRSTARIDGPVDMSKLTQSLVPASTSVMVSGEVHYTIAATTTSGRQTTYNTRGPVSTTVDLSKQPPAVAPLR